MRLRIPPTISATKSARRGMPSDRASVSIDLHRGMVTSFCRQGRDRLPSVLLEQDHLKPNHLCFVTPAKAGVQSRMLPWMPAFAGITRKNFRYNLIRSRSWSADRRHDARVTQHRLCRITERYGFGFNFF